MSRGFLHKPLDRFLHIVVFVVIVVLGFLSNGMGSAGWPWFGILLLAFVLSLYIWLAYRLGTIQRLCACRACGVTNLERFRRCRGCGCRLRWLQIEEYPSPQPTMIPVLMRAQGAAFVLTFVVVGAVALAFRVAPSVALFAIPVGVLIMFAIATWRTKIVRSAQDGVLRTEGAICPGCLYPTPPDSTVCPECGRVGDTEQVRQEWRAANLWFPARKSREADVP
ncbi:MAG: hypothetical protein U0570_12950 [Phycisphaerales bacterium]